MKNNVSVTRLKDGRKMYHVNVPDDISSEELQKLMSEAACTARDQMIKNMPPYERSHEIDEDKMYNFTLTGTALKDLIDAFNGDRRTNVKYGRIRLYEDRIVFSAATFADNGEVLPSPHAIVGKFTKTNE